LLLILFIVLYAKIKDNAGAFNVNCINRKMREDCILSKERPFNLRGELKNQTSIYMDILDFYFVREPLLHDGYFTAR
jgi:hypothetical protein